MSKCEKQENTSMRSEAEMDAFIQEQKKKAGKGMAILIASSLFLIAIAFTGSVIGIVIGIVLIGVGIYFRSSARNAIKGCMTDAALIPALKKVFDNVNYYAAGHIPDGIIRGTYMGFDFGIDKITGNDYIKAEYQGVSVEMSDISLITVTETIDEDGNKTKTEHKEFKGLWMICDFHKRFSADILLRERKGLGDKLLRKGIQTENEAFNKQFLIESESEHDVFYILTPHMMEYIQGMDKKADGRIYMRFLKQGKLYLAIDTGKDFFEVNKIGKADVEALREQFVSEIRYVTDLIDELRLVETLHQKQ